MAESAFQPGRSAWGDLWVRDVWGGLGTAVRPLGGVPGWYQQQWQDRFGGAGGSGEGQRSPVRDLFSGGPAGATQPNSMLSLKQFWEENAPKPVAGPTFTPSGVSNEWQTFLDAGVRAQMAPLESILQSGTSELQRRAAEQQKLLRLMPGQIKDTSQQQTQGVMDMAKLFGGQVNAMAPVSLEKIGMTPMAGTAPGLAGIKAIEGSRLSDVPYLDVAGRQFIGGQQTALNIAHQQAAAQVQADRAAQLKDIALAQFASQQQQGQFNAGRQDDWNRAWLGIQSDPNLIPPPMQYGPLGVDPGRGWQIQQQDPGRANELVNAFPERWRELPGLVQEAMAAGGDPSAALNAWVNEAGSEGGKRARAEMASLYLSQLGGFQP